MDNHCFINVDAFICRKRKLEDTVVHGVKNMLVDAYFIHLHVAIVPNHTTNLGHSLDSDDPFQVEVSEILCQLTRRLSGSGVSQR